jgi:hypothetical protein
MPPQHIMQGMPWRIIVIMRSQQAAYVSIDMPSIGIMRQVIMPSAPISQVIFIMGMGMGIMPPIIGIIWGIMPGIICGTI